MTKNRISYLLITWLITVPALGVGAQDKKKQDRGEIKLTTELVQIDVLVSDKNNKPVGGLKREDFELYDNNKLQQVTNFAYEETKLRRVEDAISEARSLPRAIDARELKRVIAFVVDTLHIKFENINRTRKMLEEFVDNNMQPGDLVLILPTAGGSGLLQQFTADQRLLHRAIDRLRPFYFGNESTPSRSVGRMSQPMSVGRRDESNQARAQKSAANGPGEIQDSVDPIEGADVRATLAALNETIKSMSKLPGRKVSVFISEGVRTEATGTTSDLNRTTALAARANVVFYTIDPRGLDPLNLTAADESDPDPLLPTELKMRNALESKRSDFAESQDSLNAIAVDTGGKFFRNNNDIKHGLDQMLDENSAYYMLGFYPEASRWDGKFHKVKVVVRNRPNVTVLFRKGYLAKAPSPQTPASADPKIAEALEAISSPLVRRDIDLRLTPLYIDNAQRDPTVTLLLHIDASRLSLKQSEGTYQGKVEQIGFVLDASGKTVDTISNTLDLNLQQQTYEAALKRGFVVSRTLDVKPGVYQIRLFVRDAGSGLIGTANDFIEVPDMKADRLSISSLFLSGQAVQQGKMVNTAGEEGTPSQRRFKRDGEFTYLLVIYNAKADDKTKQPRLEMRARVLKGTQVVYQGEPRPVQASQGSTPSRIITGGIIKLLQLQPDDYTLEVTVRDKLRGKESRSAIRQEMDFSVE